MAAQSYCDHLLDQARFAIAACLDQGRLGDRAFQRPVGARRVEIGPLARILENLARFERRRIEIGRHVFPNQTVSLRAKSSAQAPKSGDTYLE